MSRTILAGLTTVLVITACGQKKREGQQQTMPGMGGMSGMQGMAMRSDSLMPMMRADLDSLARLPAPFAGSMLSVHDAMASRMLDAMGAEMTAMGMKPDAAWTALTDSIKRDLADLPSLSGRAVETRLRAHVGRMRRLMAMHESMMRSGMMKR